MATNRNIARDRARQREAQLAFEALHIEGGLLAPEWLAHVARLDATGQTEADYRVPKGLNLRDEIGRYWRISQALWRDFANGRSAGADPRALAERFVFDLLHLGFGFDSLRVVAPVVVAERTYPIGFAALRGRVPVVVAPAGSGVETPSMSFGEGGRRRNAFGLAQEYLNAAEDTKWGMVSDGVTLRIVRDNGSLTRPAWIQADLGSIFAEERYADFAALWLLAHETRFGRIDGTDGGCALEDWRNAGREQGTRARDHLRRGVEEALVALGHGFISHPDNVALRAALHDGTIKEHEYFNQLLRLVYRLIFLLTIEERGLLHPKEASDDARELYADGYSLRRLRERSAKRSAHDRYSDVWEGTKIVFRGVVAGEPMLGLPALAGIFAKSQCPALDAAKLENRALLLAMFRLSWLRDASGLSRVNWRDMGPEELGSVYESLLELAPKVSVATRSFAFAGSDEAVGNARKASGSYYTRDSLVQALLDSALEPVIAQTMSAHPLGTVEALLGLAIVDPACGSGHFLLAAARRLAVHVARLQVNGTPSRDEYLHALRQVVGRCIYGVDFNLMAVELCKVALWMEAVEPGLPLTFLDAHIRHGNSLLGATPELLANGIPDEAWTALKEGDDAKIAAELKKRNAKEAAGQTTMSSQWSKPTDPADVARAVADLEAAVDTDAAALAAKESKWEKILASGAYRQQRFIADAWCAAFVWPKPAGGGAVTEAAPTMGLWRDIRDGRGQPPDQTVTTVGELVERYRFFHWHLAFPTVFAKGGFDVVLGNPPWETMSPDAKEFFAAYDPQIRFQDKATQEATITRLSQDVRIAKKWAVYRRDLFAAVHFIKNSGRYRMFAKGNLGKGDFNVYRMFVEVALTMTRKGGRASQFVPEGLYNGANCAAIRAALFDECALHALYGFVNTREIWFKDVHTAMKFAMYVAQPGGVTTVFHTGFDICSEEQLRHVVQGGGLRIPVAKVREFSPDALAIMDFGDNRDVDIAARMYSRWPKFGDKTAGPPHRTFMAEMHMGGDREAFGEDLDGVPLYEGRMVDQYDHRATGYRSGRGRAANWVDLPFGEAGKSIQPQWRIPLADVPDKVLPRMARFRAGFCDVTGPTNKRSLVAALIPAGFPAGHTVPTILFGEDEDWQYMIWVAVANSFIMDWLVRQKVQLHLTYTVVDSLPFPRLRADDVVAQALVPRALRLTCCGPEMTAYWNEMAAEGWCTSMAPDSPPPGIEDMNERLKIMAEIEVIVARDLYGLTRADEEYILGTFPRAAELETNDYGEFRSKRLILELFESLPRLAQPLRASA